MKKSIKTAIFACVFAVAFQITAFAGFSWRVESADSSYDECDCDEYIGKERDGRRADRAEGRGGDVYRGGCQRDIYREGI